MPDKSDRPEPETSHLKADETHFLTETPFKTFQLHPEISKGLKRAGFEFCTPIQDQVLPVSMEGRDIAGQAQTGTGKTAAFLITVLSKLLEKGDPSSSKGRLPSILIIAPTRELALQIHEEAELLSGDAKLKMVRVIGGIDYEKQAEDLKSGADVVICTPGRLIDYMKQRIFKPSAIDSVVIDEADRLLDMGFEKDMRYILSKLPHYEKRQSMLFSATLSHRVLELTYQYMNLPEFISVTPDHSDIEGIEQSLYHVGNHQKLSLLLGILKSEEIVHLLIFVNTKAGVEWLAAKLKGNNFPAEAITGDLPQPKRLKLMKQFKDGDIRILVATDVASRGIHVENISHVINYDLPQEADNYIHRIGRTARAGKTGKAISLACENYVFYLEAIENIMERPIPVAWAGDEMFAEDKSGPVSVRHARNPKGKNRGEKRGEKKGGPKRPPRKKASGNGGPRHSLVWNPERKSDYFPGTFFGFAPPPEPKDKPKDKTKDKPKDKPKDKKGKKETPRGKSKAPDKKDKSRDSAQNGKKPGKRARGGKSGGKKNGSRADQNGAGKGRREEKNTRKKSGPKKPAASREKKSAPKSENGADNL
ncbi:ATP-dependent RNA helicase RhlB [Candidatus Desulfarcum epimagneticum]|uniref:ATP-dependent RNA helicase RhlB n=1 Tax=uncultured Desulfobacteraceae bacterium TaxID=218296 RepID=A0A484HG86_9BACT|nr:ATP-dependent RNA helicase RhlB [uncultured Desulfobacteraceae bacterium]